MVFKYVGVFCVDNIIKGGQLTHSYFKVTFYSINYRVTHKGCDFNNDFKAFIQSFLDKLCGLHQFTDPIYVHNIIYKRLQASYKK